MPCSWGCKALHGEFGGRTDTRVCQYQCRGSATHVLRYASIAPDPDGSLKAVLNPDAQSHPPSRACQAECVGQPPGHEGQAVAGHSHSPSLGAIVLSEEIAELCPDAADEDTRGRACS